MSKSTILGLRRHQPIRRQHRGRLESTRRPRKRDQNRLARRTNRMHTRQIRRGGQRDDETMNLLAAAVTELSRIRASKRL
jgi:hypothetical protein